jgi:hypothetical protein
MTTMPGETPSTSELLLKALRRALRPLVRLMLGKGITYLQLAELLKGLFVEVADRDFPVAGKPQTDSRISLLTGIHRKDVKRLRAEILPEAPIPETVSLGMRLAAAWNEVPFADADGEPLRLPRLASGEATVSFEALVESVSKDIRPRAVLDEWLRLGVVEIDGEDRVHLKRSAFVPQQGFEEKAFYLGLNLHDHAAAIADNLAADSAGPWLERCVHYDAVRADDLDALRRDAESAAMRLLRNINRKAADSETRAAGEAAPTRRLTLGVYFYAEDAPPAASPDRPAD